MRFSKKSFIFSGLLISVVVIAMLLGVVSGCRYHGFGPPGFHGRGFQDRVLERLDEKVEDLGLSEAQKMQYQEIRYNFRANMIEANEACEELFGELRTEIDQEEPDVEAAAGLFKKALKDIPVLMERNLDLMVDLYNILDKDQQQKVLDNIQKKMKRCRFQESSEYSQEGKEG